VFETCDGKEVVTVCRLPHVDQVGQLVAVIPQVAGAELDATCRPVMRVAGDAQRFTVRADNDAPRQLHIRSPLSASAPAAPYARPGNRVAVSCARATTQI